MGSITGLRIFWKITRLYGFGWGKGVSELRAWVSAFLPRPNVPSLSVSSRDKSSGMKMQAQTSNAAVWGGLQNWSLCLRM